MVPDSSDPAQELEAKELGEIISNWLNQLPESSRRMFGAAVLVRDSLVDLSHAFGLPKALLSQRLSRMRGRLKAYLE